MSGLETPISGPGFGTINGRTVVVPTKIKFTGRVGDPREKPNPDGLFFMADIWEHGQIGQCGSCASDLSGLPWQLRVEVDGQPQLSERFPDVAQALARLRERFLLP